MVYQKPARIHVIFHRLICSHRVATSDAPDQSLREDVDDDRDQKKRQADLNQRTQIKIVSSLTEFIGDDAGHGVAGSKERLRDLRTITDEHGDSHGLAKRAP